MRPESHVTALLKAFPQDYLFRSSRYGFRLGPDRFASRPYELRKSAGQDRRPTAH